MNWLAKHLFLKEPPYRGLAIYEDIDGAEWKVEAVFSKKVLAYPYFSNRSWIGGPPIIWRTWSVQ